MKEPCCGPCGPSRIPILLGQKSNLTEYSFGSISWICLWLCSPHVAISTWKRPQGKDNANREFLRLPI